MRMLRLAGALAVAAAAVNAQSPLTTTYANNNGGSVGGGVYFNLTVNVPVAITALDCNLGVAANTVGSIDLFTVPTTHVGNENNIALWTLAASGPITSAGTGLPSNVAFATPAVLVPGTYGICIRHNGVSAAYTNGTGANQTYTNAELTLNAGSALNTAFGAGTPFSPRVFNGSIYYTNGGSGTPATVVKTGAGCIDSAMSFYQQFTTLNGFNLSNTAFQLVPSGGGYAVLPSTATFTAPVAPGLNLTDDSLSASQPLGFTLNFPGGSTTSVILCSNGYVYLGSGTAADFTPTPAELLTGGARLCPFWMDLLPNATNNVHYDVDTVNNRVLCTWNGVPEYGFTGTSNTFQVVINATGIIEVIYGACANTGHTDTMVGFSPGAGNRDPGNYNLSARIPFQTGASDASPLTQDSQRPVIGTNINLTVGNIPAGSLAGLELIGPAVAGIPIGSGCSLYVLPILTTIPFSTAGTSATIGPIGIPNDPTLVGGGLPVQAAVVNLSLNAPLGVITSNLATLNFGNY